MGLNLFLSEFLQLPFPLRQRLLTPIIFLVNLSKRRKSNAVNFCKKCGDFRGEFL